MKKKVKTVAQLVREKKVNDIYQTKDYSLFHFHKENRELKPNKVKKLVKAMSKDGYINQPIKIDTEGAIIDGQHRFEAARTVGVPILYFIDRSSMDLYENMAKTNTYADPWMKKDHVHGLAKKGLHSYLILLNFMNAYPQFSITECIMYLNNNFTGVDGDKFKTGKWKHQNVAIAKKWADNILRVQKYFPDGYNKSTFVRAMVVIFKRYPQFDFESFLHKIKIRPTSIYRCTSVPENRIMIENIYNYRRPNDDKLNLRF